MKLKISELFDLYDGGAEGERASADRVAELTMAKIHERSDTGAPRKMSRPLKFALIAAAVVLLIGSAAAFAIAKLPTEADALDMANRELHALRNAGILTGDFQLPAEGADIRLEISSENSIGLEIWNRLFNPFYYISYYDENSSISVSIDTVSGKLTAWDIIAYADEDDIPIITRVNENGQTISWYDNYDDIFDVSMTVGGLCERLCEYWGFSGYTIGETGTEYGYSFAPAEDGTLLRDSSADMPWITVYFAGDQEGVPQYIEIHPIGKGALMSVGYAHALG